MQLVLSESFTNVLKSGDELAIKEVKCKDFFVFSQLLAYLNQAIKNTDYLVQVSGAPWDTALYPHYHFKCRDSSLSISRLMNMIVSFLHGFKDWALEVIPVHDSCLPFHIQELFPFASPSFDAPLTYNEGMLFGIANCLPIPDPHQRTWSGGQSSWFVIILLFLCYTFL